MSHPTSARVPFRRALLRSRRATVPAFALVLSVAALAQQSPPPVVPEKTLDLAPFEVVADKADSYEALNTSSLSGTNRSLNQLPITAEIFNATRLADLAVTDVVELLNNYATGVGMGLGGSGSSATGTQGGDRFNMSGFRVRGLNVGAIRRNGFLTANNLGEGYAYERTEIIRGPQSLLYGTNPAGGVINVVTKKAMFGANFVAPQVRLDSEGSYRGLLDANVSGELKGHRVALRLAALDDTNYFWRDVLERKTEAIYVESAAELWPRKNTILRFEAETITGRAIESSPQVRVFGIPGQIPDNTPLSVLVARNDPVLASIAGGNISFRNVDSLTGAASATVRRHHYYTATLSSDITPWLKGQIIASRQPVDTLRDSASASTNLRAPRTGGNPLDLWAIGYRPGGIEQHQINEGIRGILTADFDVTRFTKNNLVLGGSITANPGSQLNQAYYQVDANGDFVVNPALANNADGGRTLMPIQWYDPVAQPYGYVQRFTDSYTFNGVTYRRDFSKHPNPAFATPSNPLGYNGGSAGVSLTNQKSESVFGVLFTSWAEGKVETMAGVRSDWLNIAQNATGSQVEGDGVSTNFGVVWNVTKPVALYAGYSSNFSPGSFNFASGLDGKLLPNGRGEGREAGFKLNAWDGKLSGSVTYYEAESINESEVLPAAVQTATDPAGINGRYYTTFANPSITYDRETKGVEITLTSQPVRNLRLQFGYSYAEGREGSAVEVPFLYNDQFRTDANGQVLLASGLALLVPVNPAIPVAADGRTYAAGVVTQPLTVAFLRSGDASGNYRASLDATNGRILNAAALGLSISGVGTGQVGLPISVHQLGFVPPTGPTLVARQGGDRTGGYPLHSFTFTSMYRFTDGWTKGLSLGANVNMTYDTILYYYVDTAAGNARRIERSPDITLVNLIASYEFQVSKKIKWKTQLNLNNAFDERAVDLMPNIASGVLDNGLQRNNPRMLVWTNTLTF